MNPSPYTLMQAAVDIVGTSDHPTNKIAATLAGQDAGGQAFSISKTNFWPESIKQKIGKDVRIGNSSGTVHAETACILAAPVTDDSALFITDPPCPNCVKNMAEAGVRALYIDHKGFDKDFARRRGEDFSNMSMRICDKAGISVYKIFRKEQRTETILKIPEGYSPPIENPPKIEPLEGAINAGDFETLIADHQKFYSDEPFALLTAHGQIGRSFVIAANIHPVIGYTSQTMEKPENKYSFLLQPVNRILMIAARYGLNVDKTLVFSSRVPTSRELVNLIGADVQSLHIGNAQDSRDEFGLQALAKLKNAGIFKD